MANARLYQFLYLLVTTFGASLASQCTLNIINSYSGSTAGTPVNFACVEFQASKKIKIFSSNN